MTLLTNHNELKALDRSDRFARWWWLVVLFGFLGAAVGIILVRFKTPLYNAQAMVLVSTDFNQAGYTETSNPASSPVLKSQSDEDTAINAVGQYLRLAQTPAFDYAHEIGLPTAVDWRTYFKVDREHAFWVLNVYDTDPARAQKVANHWAQVGYAALLAQQKDGNLAPYIFFDRVQDSGLPKDPLYSGTNLAALLGLLVGVIVGLAVTDLPIFAPKASPIRPAQTDVADAADPGREGFVPRDALGRILRLWWIVVVFAILGGAAGLIFHRIQPPIYEAQALFEARINNKELKFLEQTAPSAATYQLTFYDQDLSLAMVEASLRQVIPQVVAYARQNGAALDATTLMDQATIERQIVDWNLHFRDTDPALAQKVATYWAQAGIANLQAKQQSGQFPPYIAISAFQPAELPQRPLLFQTTALVLAGAAMGLILGVGFVQLPFMPRSRHD